MNDPNVEADIRERLMKASRSFRKLDGRHTLRTPDVMYCSFHTENFSVEHGEAQRNASMRIARFGLKARNLRRKTVLDLGSNAGAMLFEMSNMGIRSGLGVEFDEDKVQLSREIAALSNLSQLRFEQGDIDMLEADDLGRFDIVLALAIESHVLNPEKLYRLLGDVTKRILCFEGNGGADTEKITSNLLANGFRKVKYIGFCDDDLRAANNKRPMFVARK